MRKAGVAIVRTFGKVVDMCRQVTCKTCGKASWAGCGMHVEQVLGHLSADQRCECHLAPPALAESGARKRWFSRS